MGLLSKASSITSVSKPAFPKFIISHKIKTYAQFQCIDNLYTITNSIGFDGSSLLSSTSTKDFWDGICPNENEVYKFDNEDKSLNPLLQFFSFDLIEHIKYLSLYKTDNNIYMLCNQDFNQDIINDLTDIDYNQDYINLDEINKKITKDTKLIKLDINFSEAVASFISVKGKDIDNKDEMKSILFKELINRFTCGISPFSTKKESSSEIKTVICVDKTINYDHLVSHIVYSLRKVLGPTADMISFTNLGDAVNLADLKSFLQVE